MPCVSCGGSFSAHEQTFMLAQGEQCYLCHKEENPAIVNLTPHEVVVIPDPDFPSMSYHFPPSGTQARVSEVVSPLKTISRHLPLITKEYGEVTGLPEAVNGVNVMYIVSFMVMQALPDRNDLLVPDTGRAIRNERGQIIGVPAFM